MITGVIQVYGGDGVEAVEIGEITVRFRNLAVEADDTETVLISFDTITEAITFQKRLQEKIDSGSVFVNFRILQREVIDDHDDFYFERCIIHRVKLVDGHPVLAMNLTDQTSAKWSR